MRSAATLLSILILGLISCNTDRNLITIDEMNFEEEISVVQNLEFTLNQHLFNDSLFNRWVDEELLSIQPHVQGKFKIVSSDKILFSPTGGFAESEIFTANLSDNLHKYTDVKLAVKNDPIQFHTPLLDLKSVNIYWIKEDASNEIVLHADLDFNATVNAEELKKFLKISQSKEEKTINFVTTQNAKTISVAVHNMNPKAENRNMEFTVLKGIGSPGSNYKNEKDIKLNVEIPFIESLEIKDMIAEHTGVTGTVRVITNQQIGNSNLNGVVTVEPPLTFEIEKTLNGLVIKSDDFNAAQSYTVTLSENLFGVAGGKMIDSYSQSITFGELEPKIQFTHNKGMYLGKKGNKNISVQIINVPKVKVEILKVYENNILGFMRDGFRYRWYDEYNEDENYWDYFDYEDVNIELYGNVIYEKEYETSKLEKYNSARILHVDVLDNLERFDGFYVVRVSSEEKRWLTDAQIVSLSDIGLISKATEDELVVFANSIQSATPLNGIKVSFVSSNNQKLYTATTDKNGVAKFTGIKKNLPDFDVNLITAENGSDFNFLPFSQTEVSTSRFEVGGKRLNESDMDAFLYVQRDMYRPGETMHIAGVIRTYDWEILPRIPVKLRIVSPSGKEFKSVKKTLDDQGGFEASIDIPKAAVTGTYTAELYSSNDVLLNSEYISVEEFMPDRIRVDASLPKKEFYPGDAVTNTIIANNLYGTPAANRNWEAEMNLNKFYFSSKKYPEYNFSINGADSYIPTKTTEGTTGENGNANAEFVIPEEYKNMGLLSGRIMTTVFDESGRPVYNVQDFKVITQNTLFGIGDFDYYMKTRSTIKIPFVAVDKDDKLINGAPAKVEIIKHEYETVIERSGTYYKYRSNKVEKLLSTHNITVTGTTTSVSYTPELSGQYEVRIKLPNASTYVSRYFYAYGWGNTQSNSFEVNTEGNINIVADKENYNVGEDANIIFTAPFNGKLLVTVERNKVYEYYYLDTDKKSASLKLKINNTHLPNIYITATLFRPADNSELPLTVAHGITNLKVDNPSKKLNVAVTHEKNSRSNKKQTISIKTAPNAELTVAVVDEGILQIKNFQTPDPYNWFYQSHALSVLSYDLYAYLYPEIYLKKLLSGGDGYDLEGRLNPMTANRVKLVSYWSGIIKSDANGKAKFDIDIPQFSGDLRVMVVAYKNDLFGSSETHMKVADPIVVTTSLPRFLSPGDTITVPVTLANTTGKNTSGNVNISVEGPIKIAGNTTQDFSANANKESRAEFKIVATNQTGNAKVKVVVSAMNEKFMEEIEIPVRPPASLQKYNGSGFADAGKTSEINISNNLEPQSAKAKLVLSTSPLVQFADDLDYLINYPHGCVEQITSSVFPQIYYSDLIKTIYGKENKDLNPSYNVQEGIRILESMQMYNGALMYWPGGGYESWWGTIYATHFMMEAKKAGFDVDEKVLNKSYGYMKNMLKQKKTFVYYYNNNLSKEMASKEVFYSMYVLALAGKAEISTMNYYKANLSVVPLDGKYLLAMSYLAAGDKKSYEKLLPSAFAGEESVQVFGGSFYSPIRDRAIALNCMLETDPENQQIGILAQQLSEMMKMRPYLNTQERSFAFLAFGKLARKTKDATITATIKADGKEIGKFSGKDLVIEDKTMLNKKITIESAGKGQLFYFWMTSGVTSDGSYKQEDSYLKVRKTFYDRWGQQIDLKKIKQNDLVIVKISLQAATSLYVENVVITDILPAGFEIENDRLRATASLSWIKDQAQAQHEDIRDDRINLYVTASSTIQNYYYTVRAVSPGTYKMGPVMADAMYNEEYHSYNGSGIVKISK